jgi:aminoglycoside phosphotransferase (APT) family kinase protein
MKTRRERKNIIEFVDEKIIRKVGVVQEESRPHRLKVEAWALSQAKVRGINVPRVIDYYRDTEGNEVLVLERIHGKSLSMNASRENIDCMFDVGHQLALLNNISANYGWIDPFSMAGNSENWTSFILSYVQIYGERLVKEKIIEGSHLQKVYRRIQASKLNISVSFLVNRDLRLSHLIRDDNGEVWILDWENVILGDPLYDLAIFGVRYGHGTLWQNLKSGYGFSFLPPQYVLYETIALIGIIDFCRKNNVNYQGRLKQLQKLIMSI